MDGPDELPAGSGAGPTAPSRTSWVQRLLDNKTGPQRAVISLGALAAALIAIGAAVAAVVRLLDDDGDAGGGAGSVDVVAPDGTQRVESATAAADEMVRSLLDHDGAVVELDHQVIAEKGPADVSLRYACTDAGVCATVRLQDVRVVAGELPDGRWFQGCFAVAQDGVGYGAEPLDIELVHQGETC